jgi:hypothetical protein
MGHRKILSLAGGSTRFRPEVQNVAFWQISLKKSVLGLAATARRPCLLKSELPEVSAFNPPQAGSIT